MKFYKQKFVDLNKLKKKRISKGIIPLNPHIILSSDYVKSKYVNISLKELKHILYKNFSKLGEYIYEHVNIANKYYLETLEYLFKRYRYGCYMSTEIDKHKCLLSIDCDEQSNVNTVIQSLKLLGITNYIIYESTPNKFWFVCDNIDSVQSNIRILGKIHGIDVKYYECAKYTSKLVLRAFPKKAIVPSVYLRNYDINTASKEFLNWIDEFDKFWNSEFIKIICDIQISIVLL